MRLRRYLALMTAAAVAGCGGDRPTGPADEADRAASELERAAAELGLGADPAAALTYQSVAAAVRGGAPVQRVEIAVDGKLQTWYAFGHEIRFRPSTAGTPTDFPIGSGIRALLAWRATEGGSVRVIHLDAWGDSGPIGDLAAINLTGNSVEYPSSLMYSEGRNLFWQGTRGRQWSSVTAGSTPCPAPRRPAGAAAPPTAPQCVLATFKFRFSDVEAEPFSFPFAPIGFTPPAATGKRTLSMGEHTVHGVQMTIDLRAFPFPPSAARAVP